MDILLHAAIIVAIRIRRKVAAHSVSRRCEWDVSRLLPTGRGPLKLAISFATGEVGHA